MNDHQKRTAPEAGPGLFMKGKCMSTMTYNSNASLENQARATCRDCSFYRAIGLPSGRVRRLCMLTGERLTTAATPCAHFMPGDWETTWADPDAPRQSLVCGLCGNAAPSTRRAALLGVVGCLSGHVVDGAAYPVHCRDFRARGGRHAA